MKLQMLNADMQSKHTFEKIRLLNSDTVICIQRILILALLKQRLLDYKIRII